MQRKDVSLSVHLTYDKLHRWLIVNLRHYICWSHLRYKENFFLWGSLYFIGLSPNRYKAQILAYFFFLNEELFRIFFWIFKRFKRKLGIFNIRFVSYSVSLQSNIKWNFWRKTCFCVFWNQEFFEFLNVFSNFFGEKWGIFNSGYVSYNVNLQPDIR